MAIVSIIEFQDMPTTSGPGNPAVPVGAFVTPGMIVQPVITLSGASQQSAAFGPKTAFIRVHNSGIMNFTIGANPTAVLQAAGRQPADRTEYFGVSAGDKIAVITDT
jgi:hypothetical protein